MSGFENVVPSETPSPYGPLRVQLQQMSLPTSSAAAWSSSSSSLSVAEVHRHIDGTGMTHPHTGGQSQYSGSTAVRDQSARPIQTGAKSSMTGSSRRLTAADEDSMECRSEVSCDSRAQSPTPVAYQIPLHVWKTMVKEGLVGGERDPFRYGMTIERVTTVQTVVQSPVNTQSSDWARTMDRLRSCEPHVMPPNGLVASPTSPGRGTADSGQWRSQTSTAVPLGVSSGIGSLPINAQNTQNAIGYRGSSQPDPQNSVVQLVRSSSVYRLQGIGDNVEVVEYREISKAFALAILAIIFCDLLLGVIALALVFQARHAWRHADWRSARRYIDTSHALDLAGLIIKIIVIASIGLGVGLSMH